MEVIRPWDQRAEEVKPYLVPLTEDETATLNRFCMRAEINELRKALYGTEDAIDADPPSDHMQLSKWEQAAFIRLRSTLGLKTVGILEVLESANVRIQRLANELKAAHEQIPKLKPKYEYRVCHENGMMLDWMPLNVSTDKEADEYTQYGARGVWRRI
jgi:hypothetical protein